MKPLLIGLGNPGKKYAATRHNAGKLFVAWLRKVQESTKRYKKVQEGEIELIETECFMNSSGDWVYNAYKNYKMPKAPLRGYKDYSHLFVVHDDLDLPLGSFKIQFGRGPRDHQGLLSIYQTLGTKKFWHVRIGIDNRKLQESRVKSQEGGQKSRESGETYTLKPFRKEESQILQDTFPQIMEELERILRI